MLVLNNPYSQFKPPQANPSTCPSRIWSRPFESGGSIFKGSAFCGRLHSSPLCAAIAASAEFTSYKVMECGPSPIMSVPVWPWILACHS
jgi:hypothetical protein